ncbi:protein NipSnap-like [Ornithodoros turicata]
MRDEKMANLWRMRCLLSPSSYSLGLQISRCIATSQSHNAGTSEGWLNKLLHVRKIEPGKDSHSRLLSDTETVYELQIHDVKPEAVEPYLKGYEKYSQLLQSKSSDTRLIGSWQVVIGDQDQYIHVWQFKQGWRTAHNTISVCNEDADLRALQRDEAKYLRARQNQLMLPFSFWGNPEPKDHGGMYEIRSYVLKPGTMIEWGNNWARGITFRRANAVAGFFSQIGQLYMVHHIWTYKDLQARKDIREDNWRKPGWDECVAYTVPLIREMRSRWMSPTSFSPLK